MVIIPHHGEAGALAHQQFDQFILAGVGILILIHQQILDFLLPTLAYLGVGLQQQGRHQDQIVKVEGVIGRHVTLIALIQHRLALFVGITGPFQGHARQHQVIFPVGDGIQ